MKLRGPIIRAPIIFATLSVILSPFFFVIYRLSVFNTVPRDDYAPFLLWMAGDPQGAFPDSPYCYRILSMVPALLLYHLTPALHLSNTPEGITPAYLKATTALSSLAFLASVASAMLAFHLAIRKGGLSRPEAMLAGALLFALCWYTQIVSIDTLAIMMITAGLCVVEKRWTFAGLVLLSVLVNEKIAPVLAIWLSVRCIPHRDDLTRLWPQWIASLTGVAAYGAIVTIVHLPGNPYQTDLSNYPLTAHENLTAWLTGRGVILNLLPTLVLSALAVAGMLRAPDSPVRRWFRGTDILVIPALLVVALVMTHLFQAGRIVMHAAPLFVVPAIAALRDRKG